MMSELNVLETLLVIEYLLILECQDPVQRRERESAFADHLLGFIEDTHGEAIFCREGRERSRRAALDIELNRIFGILDRCRSVAHPGYRGSFIPDLESLAPAINDHCVECERRAMVRMFIDSMDAVLPGAGGWLTRKFLPRREIFKSSDRSEDHENSGTRTRTDHSQQEARRHHDEFEREESRERKSIADKVIHGIEEEELEEHERIERQVTLLEGELLLCEQILEGERDPQHPKERLTGAKRQRVLARIGQLREQIVELRHRDQHS